MGSEIDSLRQENARLIARITELEGEKMELKKIIADSSAEIGKLSARIEELENKPDTAKPESEIVELRERVTEL
jgi:predicted  nucleic acid-binding Zn-ribbon protein